MSAAQIPDNFWLLADPAQEVLVNGRPAFSQLAAVPLHQFGTPMSSADLRWAAADAIPEAQPSAD